MRGGGCVGGRLAGASGRACGTAWPGSSMRSRMLGGSTRLPRAGGAWSAAGSGSGSGRGAGSGSTGSGGASITAGVAASGADAGGAATTSTGGGAATSATWLSSWCSTSSGAAAGAAGFTVRISRGGGSDGAAGLGGSGAGCPFFGAAVLALADFTAASENMSPLGSSTPRCRASRSTNWRATISSTVLDALFSSMPWFCLSRWSTS